MSYRDRARSFLVYGFVTSLAMHLIVLPFIPSAPTVTVTEEPPDLLRREPIPPPVPRPSPTLRPTAPPMPPRATPRPAHPQRIRIHALRQDSHRGGPSEPPNWYASGDQSDLPHGLDPAAPAANPAPAGPVAPPSPTATPQPTPSPLSCARPDVPAVTLHAAEPETPPLAVQQSVAGTVEVVVTLDARSKVVAARVQSSPSALLDAAALAAARGSQFRTAIQNCEPVGADYLFSVEFTAQ